MRKILFTFIVLCVIAFSAMAQIRVGAFVGYTTAPDHESPNLYQDTNRFFPGFTISAEKSLPKGFAFVVDGDVTKTPQLPGLFTTDEGEHKSQAEVRAWPRVKFTAGRWFFAAGADTFYTFVEGDEDEDYSRSFGVNPTATAGVKLGNNEVGVTYLFRDKGTDLYGFRANFDRNFGKFAVGVEANRLQYKERNREGYVDSYYETDNVFKLKFTIPLGKGK